MPRSHSSRGPIAVLKLPRANAALIMFAKTTIGAMTGNKKLPNPDPPIEAVQADLDELEKAAAAAASRAVGTAQQRDAAKAKLIRDLVRWKDYVQHVAEAEPTYADAVAVILSANMSVKAPAKHNKAPLDVRDGEVSGSVLLVATAVAQVATYFWQYSLDNKTWVDVPETMKCFTTITGLPSGQTVYFRFRALTRSRQIGFSQVVHAVVK
jgi:hypothetical protein